MAKKKAKKSCKRCGGMGYIKWFKHWRSGKIMKAEDYNIKAWPVPCGCNR